MSGHTHIHTHRTTTVTLAAHARRGLTTESTLIIMRTHTLFSGIIINMCDAEHQASEVTHTWYLTSIVRIIYSLIRPLNFNDPVTFVRCTLYCTIHYHIGHNITLSHYHIGHNITLGTISHYHIGHNITLSHWAQYHIGHNITLSHYHIGHNITYHNITLGTISHWAKYHISHWAQYHIERIFSINITLGGYLV